MARKTKLTPALQEKICTLITNGNFYYTAAQANGIDYSTFRLWMNKGEEGKPPYSQFFDAVKAAESVAEAALVGLWSTAAIDTWQAARALLERRHRERWGRTQTIELSGPAGGPVETINLASLTNAQLTQLETILEQAAHAEPGPDSAGD